MLTVSLAGYSQIGITNNTDTSNVVISSRVARLILKDLIMFDGCKEELKLTQLKVTKLEERESQKDTSISILKQKDENNSMMLLQKDEQLKISKELSQKLQKEVKLNKIEKKFYKISSIIGLVLTTYFILK
jgi:anti-sigma-K factor RskA